MTYQEMKAAGIISGHRTTQANPTPQERREALGEEYEAGFDAPHEDQTENEE